MPGDPTAVTPPRGYQRIGRLGRAYQLEGGIRLQPSDPHARPSLSPGGRLFVVGFGAARLRAVRRLGGAQVMYLEGVRDRDAARALVGAEVFAPAAAGAASSDAAQRLLGAEVRMGGAVIGSVREVRPAHGNTLLVVDVAGDELLLPLAAPYVHVEAGAVLLIDPPEGLLPPP